MPLIEGLESLIVRERPDLSRLVLVQMDDYAQRDGDGFRLVPEQAEHSCVRFAHEEVLGRFNRHLPESRQVRPENLWTPDPADPDSYDDRIEAAGGVDLFVLATGQRDGHVAFNQPGSAVDSRTRIIELGEWTRRDNLSTFPSFRDDLDNVPRYGISVGIGTISRLSKSVVMLAWGAEKARSVERLASATGYEADWPATVLSICHDPRFIVDRAAAASIRPETAASQNAASQNAAKE